MNPSVQHDDARFLDLLRRWQSGDFTRSDEQELKALTDSDDFRREAMEGFMSLPGEDHDSRLLALHNKIRLRSGLTMEPARRVALFRIGAAAAVLLLLICAIWMFPKRAIDRTAPIATKQSEPSGNTVFSQPVVPQNKDDQQVADVSESRPPLAAAPERSSAAAAKQDKPLAGPAETADLATAEKTEEVGKAATAQYEAPEAAVPVTAPAREDKMAGQTLSKPQQNEPPSAPATGAKDLSKAKKMKVPARSEDSIWHRTDVKPDMDAAKKEAREAMQPQFSEPAGGWDAFNEYLRQNARLTPEARNNNVSGTVRLEFTVNGNGEPQNFMTLRSLGYGCDEEAVRLVKTWDWVRGKSPNVTVEVRFVR